jgi:hypothetical protein
VLNGDVNPLGNHAVCPRLVKWEQSQRPRAMRTGACNSDDNIVIFASSVGTHLNNN